MLVAAGAHGLAEAIGDETLARAVDDVELFVRQPACDASTA